MLFNLGKTNICHQCLEPQESCHGSVKNNQKEMVEQTLEGFVRNISYSTRGYMARLLEFLLFQVRTKGVLKSIQFLI